MEDPRTFRQLLEKVKAESEVYKIKLPVKASSLQPVFSENSISLHYGKLYSNYVEKAHEGEGEFFFAGAKLHTLFFEQLQAPASTNNPTGAIEILIDKKFGSFEKFKSAFNEVALSIRGSGWVYLDKSGEIKTIENHKVVSNVAIIIDMWEHSYILDYGSDKEKYLRNMWKVINWQIINSRIN